MTDGASGVTAIKVNIPSYIVDQMHDDRVWREKGGRLRPRNPSMSVEIPYVIGGDSVSMVHGVLLGMRWSGRV